MSDNMVALELGNTKRKRMLELRCRVKNGAATPADVLLTEAELVCNMMLSEVVAWGWPGMGAVRIAAVGKLAAKEGVNLLLTVGRASWSTRDKVALMIGAVRDGEAYEHVDESSEPEVAPWHLRRMLARAEVERDTAQRRAAELDAQLRGQQLVMPTVSVERMLADLADAVEEHWRAVSGSSPIDDWAMADERLKARKDAILASDAPALRAVA